MNRKGAAKMAIVKQAVRLSNRKKDAAGIWNLSTLYTIMENTDAHLAFLDIDFNFVIVNSTYAEGACYRKEELIGRNHFDLFPSEENQQIFELARETGEPVTFKEKPFQYADQPERGVTYWDWRLTPVKGITGLVEGFVFSLEDVTDSVRSRKFGELLHEINKLINFSYDFEGTAQQVLAKASEALCCDSAWIALKSGRGWILKYGWGKLNYEIGMKLDNAQAPISGLCLNKLQPLIITDIFKSKHKKIIRHHNLGVAAVIAVPLMVRGKAVGVLTFNYRKPTSFSKIQVNFIQSLGDTISLALENTRLYKRVIRHNERLEKVVQRRTLQHKRTNELLRIFAIKTSRKEYLRCVVELISRWSGCNKVGIRVLKSDGTSPYEAHVGFSDDFCLSEGCVSAKTDPCICTRILQQKLELYDKPVITGGGSFLCNNTEEFVKIHSKDIQTGFRGVCIANGWKTVAAIPICYQNQVFGVVQIAEERENALPPKLVEFIETMTPLIGEALFSFNLEEEMARLDRLNLVGEMAAGIGHEIRNPMTTARGFLQLLQGKDECANYKEYFELIISELDRANGIITEYLSMAKNRPIKLKRHDLNTIIHSISSLIKADATLANKTVGVKLWNIPTLMLDEKEIRQLILNLARNGLEAMSEGGHLTIETYCVGEEVILAVKDMGSGIDPKLAGKIGTPFFTTKDNGTGLGLAICYSIAERHGAVVDFDSQSTGTTFFVRFNTQKNKAL